jgi:hypothetical protein
MAKNVTLMGAEYPNVPAVQLPQTGGGTASFVDPEGLLPFKNIKNVTTSTQATVNVISNTRLYLFTFPINGDSGSIHEIISNSSGVIYSNLIAGSNRINIESSAKNVFKITGYSSSATAVYAVIFEGLITSVS